MERSNAVGDRRVCQIAITDTKPLRNNMARLYDEFIPTVTAFGKQIPSNLRGTPTHLDPDFEQLTYGDQGQRARCITTNLSAGGLLAFFAALRPVDGPSVPLNYALIGMFVVSEILSARDIPMERWHENAHTRRIPTDSDLVIRAKPGVSGRLKRCIPIGEYRDRAYRVRKEILNSWGGLDVKNGYIQRSARLPRFLNAPKFYNWFQAQNPELIAENNPI